MISNLTRQLFQKQTIRSSYGFRSLFLMMAIGFFSITASAQVATWTGAVDSAWENPANWNPNTIPATTDDVLIPDVSPNMSPVIASAVTVKSIEIAAGAQLTVNSSAGTITQLVILDSDDEGILNDGTLVNNGSIRIGSQGFNDPTVPIGILNNGTIINSTTGIITGESGIGTTGDPNTRFILNNGQFTNEGSIRGAGLSVTAIEIDQMGTFTNTGQIIFFNSPEALPFWVRNGSLNNQGDGQIAIFGGIRGQVEQDGIITNEGCGGFGNSNGIINNGGLITNSGYFFIGFEFDNGLVVLPSINTGTIINEPDGNIIIYADPVFEAGSNPIQDSGINNIAFEEVELPISCTPTTSYSPFVTFDPSNLTVEFFSDQNGNTSAGSFDNTTNTFTPNDPSQTEFFIRVTNPACPGIFPTIFPYNIVFVVPDADMDNVSDCNDLCLDTPIGEAVNSDGCSCSQLTVDDNDPCTDDVCVDGIVTNTFVDTDGDAICDANDDCPGTPAGETTNADGCACSQLTADDNDPCTDDVCIDGIITNTFVDSDGDAICDANDDCPGTPVGETTNADGCACSQLTADDNDPCTDDVCVDGIITNTFVDSDGDAICDANDDCPGTPVGETTNADGCACSQLTADDNDPCTDDVCIDGIITNTFIDTDGDAICDANDACPGTPAGEATNADGCACSQLTADDNDPCTDDVCVDGIVTNTFVDTDGDAICDANDACPGTPAGEATNADGCACSQLTADDNDPCTDDVCVDGIITNTFVDSDGDAICDANDDCPGTPAGETTNADGCACSQLTVDDNDPCTDDVCIDGIITNTFVDSDGDAICDANDDCPGTPAGEATNADGCACSQLTADDNDPCTDDVCVDGVTTNTFIDSDGDLTCDANDGCPDDPNKIAPGVCGCGVEDIDSNGDGIFDCENMSTYCPAMGQSTQYEWIQNVGINGVHNTSGDDGGYGDYTTTNFSLTTGNNNTINLTPGFSGNLYYEYWTVYIDLNQDGDFFDQGELVYNRRTPYGFIDCLHIPNSAITGTTQMRVMMSFNGWAYPCDTFNDGEVEDYTVTITEPVINYCDATGNNSSEEWIKKVRLNDINNTTGNDGGYGDYTSLSTQLTQGETKSILLKPGFSNYAYREYWKVWVDWNQDGDFNDYGELEVAASSYGNIWGHISVPHNAVTGPTRMRVAMKYGSWPSSCGNFAYGEVEDYTIMVTNSQSLSSQPTPNDEMIKLTATPKLNKVQLDWINDTGDQNDYFVVEKSLDGRNFEMITTVENQKRDQTMRNYTATDIKAVKGVNYYRIKLIMMDGTERYSDIQSATITQDPDLVTVYPNPASEQVYINLKSFSGMGAQVMIVNNFGKIVYEESIKTIQKTTHRIDLDGLQAGHYTISILVEGRKRIAKPLVIVRM